MATQIKIRRDTAANWTTADPTLGQGEPALETDTLKEKIGDGVTAWVSLPYKAAGAGDVTGPASAADENITVFDSTTGKLIKDSGISSNTKSLTGVSLDVSNNIAGIIYNEATPSTGAAFSISAIKAGGYVECYIDTTGASDFPTMTNSFGAKQQTQSNDWKVNTIFKMYVRAINATDIEYFFVDYLGTATTPYEFAFSDEATPFTVSTVYTKRMLRAISDITKVGISVSVAPTGAKLEFDVKINTVSMFTTKPTIDISEFTTETAAIQQVLNGTQSLAVGDEIQLSITQIGSTVAGAGGQCSIFNN